MAPTLYTLNDIHQLRSSSVHPLPGQVTSLIRHLESLIVIPVHEHPVSSPSSETTTKPFVKRNHVNTKKEKHGHYHKSNHAEDWTTVDKFKPTKKEPVVEGVEKDINDIRISLNKMSNKNYEVQKELILQHVTRIVEQQTENHDGNYVHKVAQFVFDVASANKFYSELYADLYQSLFHAFGGVFFDILLSYVGTFKTSVDGIMYCDPNVDYDGYCKYVKENDKRRALSNFMVMLVNRSVLPVDLLVDIVLYFQTVLRNDIDQENKTQECDEMSELLCGILSTNSVLRSTTVWQNQIVPFIDLFSTFNCKDKTHPSLSSRSVFKYLDLQDKMKKTKQNNIAE